MPIYEYECTGCHHHFDLIQKMTEEPIKRCPQCAENKVIRLVSAAGFQLKGSGWYATDFKTKSASTEPSTEVKSSTEASQSDTKPTSTSTAGSESE